MVQALLGDLGGLALNLMITPTALAAGRHSHSTSSRQTSIPPDGLKQPILVNSILNVLVQLNQTLHHFWHVHVMLVSSSVLLVNVQ